MEQAAFNPLNIVDGIGFSPDKMLQGRLFSYGDAQRYRLGVNLDQIPVNRPRVAVHSYHRDGAMRVDGNFGATVSYTPNSYGVWSDSPELKEPPLPLHGPVDNYDERAYDDDYYSQPGALFRLMTPEEKQALFEIRRAPWVTANSSSSNATCATATAPTRLTAGGWPMRSASLWTKRSTRRTTPRSTLPLRWFN